MVVHDESPTFWRYGGIDAKRNSKIMLGGILAAARGSQRLYSQAA